MNNATPASMRKQCRVLMELADSGAELSTAELADRVGLTTDQTSAALRSLLRKAKIKRVRGPHRGGVHHFDDGSNGYRYAYNLDEPIPDQKHTRGRPAKVTIRKQRAKLRYTPPKIAVLKIRLLERLLPRVGGDDRDLMLSMIDDYRESVGWGGQCPLTPES